VPCIVVKPRSRALEFAPTLRRRNSDGAEKALWRARQAARNSGLA
jgi:hypothetical protein